MMDAQCITVSNPEDSDWLLVVALKTSDAVAQGQPTGVPLSCGIDVGVCGSSRATYKEVLVGMIHSASD